MDLKSCDDCGLVYDADKINFPTPDQIYDAEHEGRLHEVGEWSGNGYTPVIKCICGGIVRRDER